MFPTSQVSVSGVCRVDDIPKLLRKGTITDERVRNSSLLSHLVISVHGAGLMGGCSPYQEFLRITHENVVPMKQNTLRDISVRDGN